MEKILILDSNSLINRAYYALPNFSNRKGQFTGAIFGYMNMLLKLIDSYKPEYIIAAFDKKGPTFRKQIYSEYKGTRKPMPQELAQQLQPMKDVLKAMGIPILEMDGYEADDIIGTIAKKYNKKTYIVTGDKDSLQLIDDTTTVLLTRKGVSDIDEYTPEKLKEEGLIPSQIIDLKSLMGDSSDNIPGVIGIGEKTARDLLAKYQTLDGVYEHIDDIKGKLQEKLLLGKESAYMSYDLATINIKTPIDINLDEAKLKRPYDMSLRDILRELELNKIIERLEFTGESKKEEPVKIVEINELNELENLILKVKQTQKFSMYINQDVEIALDKNNAYKINISDNLLGGIFYDDLMDRLVTLFEDENINKIFYDVKSIMHQLDTRCEIKLPYEDILVKAYILDANRNYKSLDDLIMTCNINSKSNAAAMIMVDDEITSILKEKDLYKLYENIEKPLINVLFNMEKEGFRVDKNLILNLSEKFAQEINYITLKIYDCVGEEFNINSTKQLGSILFDKLGLPTEKKTKTGYSTSVEVLQDLEKNHPVIPLILRYREIQKLKSTYLDGMLPLIDREDKLHTTFMQTVTATGRLSSTEPNLQNIPVRKAEGKQIRGMFIASKGRKLVCADYSQIELRLMAAFSEDESMIEAFNNDVDIHTTTASKVFNIPMDLVSSDLRRQAKAVNFGIIYGISDFGLSKDLSISVKMAKDFINNYFMQYPKVHEYMEKLKKIAKDTGYAKTMMGRVRYIPELSSSNWNIRNFGERIAMNMPLQGSASDIIKLAMIKVYNSLNENHLKSKLIMQVHDELIVDAYEDEIEVVKKILKECMENVVDLKVKLVADVGVGDSWLEAK